MKQGLDQAALKQAFWEFLKGYPELQQPYCKHSAQLLESYKEHSAQLQQSNKDSSAQSCQLCKDYSAMVLNYGVDNDSLESLYELYSPISKPYDSGELQDFVEGQPKLVKYAAALLAIREYRP